MIPLQIVPQRILLFIACIFLPVPADAGIYKWVDEEGRMHYSDAPPKGGSREIETESGPSDEQIRRARDEMKSFLQRQDQRSEAYREAREKTRQQKLAAEEEDSRHIKNCIFAQEQLRKLKLLRPVFRIVGKGEEIYVDYQGKRLIFGDNDELIFNDWVDGERVYMDDDQRALEIDSYQVEVGAYCDTDRMDPEKLDEARSKLYQDRICARARENLDKLADPQMHTPSSDIRKAESWIKHFCNE